LPEGIKPTLRKLWLKWTASRNRRKSNPAVAATTVQEDALVTESATKKDEVNL
jgi:hypothetical protein